MTPECERALMSVRHAEYRHVTPYCGSRIAACADDAMVVEENCVHKFHYPNDPMPEKQAMEYDEIKLTRLFGGDFMRYISIVHCAIGEDFLVTTDFDEEGWLREELRDFFWAKTDAIHKSLDQGITLQTFVAGNDPRSATARGR